jgi:hypothetical protein
MRSEADIRKQVEKRLRRWAFLLLHVILWAGVAKGLAYLTSVRTDGWSQTLLLGMALWASLIGLHVLRTLYVEAREFLVRQAIEREYGRYESPGSYEKPKRLEISDDGELVSWDSAAFETDRKARDER